MSDRQTGRTAKQMLEAPRGATFVWCNDKTQYARSLARHLGRGDLRIMGLESLRDWNSFCDAKVVVLDHAIRVYADGPFRPAYQFLVQNGRLAEALDHGV